MAERTVQVAFRLPEAMVDDLDREVARLRVQHPAFRIARADVVRDILHQYFAGVVHESPPLVQSGVPVAPEPTPAPPEAVHTEAAPRNGRTSSDEVIFDPDKHVMGTLCDRGHNYQSSGRSVRKATGTRKGTCLLCERETARRTAQRQAAKAS